VWPTRGVVFRFDTALSDFVAADYKQVESLRVHFTAGGARLEMTARGRPAGASPDIILSPSLETIMSLSALIDAYVGVRTGLPASLLTV
jgi:hypothetical protein